MAKKNFQKIADILLRPFREHFLFFIVFFILATSCYIIRHLVIEFYPIAAFSTAIHCFNISYIVTLLVGIIRPKVARKIIQVILIVLAAIDFALNFYCICHLKYLFDADTALLILETDANEAKEFITAMIPKGIVIAEIAIYLVLFFLWRLSTHRNLNLGKKASLFALGLACMNLVGNLYFWNVWKDGPIARFWEISQYDVPSDLKSYYSHPQLTYNEKQDLPLNVVLIIGESFARCHSSLYGYDKPTNPQLKSLKDDSLLFTIDSIDSPAGNTAPSIMKMMSTFSQADENNNDKKWYEYISLIELMKESGYDCFWFGNQACANKNNGIARTYAHACDQQFFFQHEGIDEVNDRYDIVLVDSSFQYINQFSKRKHNFFIYHMLGSHFNYNMRYPKNYAKFSEKDYPTDPQNHREILSTYDNSILYNDFVVKKIMDLFKDSESVVIYVPDHGQVMYRNKRNPDYYAHGKGKYDYAYGVEIPFFIFASPLYQERHPTIMQRIRERQNNPKSWNSEDLPYFIMDLIGVKTINGEEVRPRSVLN